MAEPIFSGLLGPGCWNPATQETCQLVEINMKIIISNVDKVLLAIFVVLEIMFSEWEITLHTEHFNYVHNIIKRLMKKNVLSSTYPALGNVQRGHSQNQKISLVYVHFPCCHMYTHMLSSLNHFSIPAQKFRDRRLTKPDHLGRWECYLSDMLPELFLKYTCVVLFA